MSVEAFKFGNLIAIAKRLGSSDLYHVKITGMNDEFETAVKAKNHQDAILHVIEELIFAADHPHKFFNRRRLAAVQSGEDAQEVQRMIDLANEAVAYAHRNVAELKRSVNSIEKCTSRKLGE